HSGSKLARQDRSADHVSRITPYVGFSRGDERRASDGSGAQPRPRRYQDGGEGLRPPGAELHQRRHPRRRAAVQHSLWQRGAAAQTKNKKRSVRTLADLLLQRVGVGSLTIGVMIASHIGRQWLTSAHRVYPSLNPTGTRSPSVWRWMSVVGWRSLRRRTQSGVTDTRPWLRGGVPKDIDLARSGVTPAQ